MPAPPPPISSNLAPQILPSYFSPSSSNIAAPVEQLLVRTRSVGVNTCEVGVVTEPECLGPCEPGTSVNLEGIVWHETEEGKYDLFIFLSSLPLLCPFSLYCTCVHLSREFECFCRISGLHAWNVVDRTAMCWFGQLCIQDEFYFSHSPGRTGEQTEHFSWLPRDAGK